MSVEVQQYFDVKYGTNLELVNLEKDPNGINFVSRTGEENGVSGKVKEIPTIEPFKEGLITVAVGGSVMESFVQPEPFYTGFHVMVLEPKIRMNINEKLFYCLCLRRNKYKYNYGRQANKTLKKIKIPSIDDIPKYVNNTKMPEAPDEKPILNRNFVLNVNNWKFFRYDDIFQIHNGYYNKKPKKSIEGIPFIGGTEKNNGITSYHKLEDIKNYNREGRLETNATEKRIFNGNCITISNNGSVGYAFFQSEEFTCSHDVNPVYLKEKKMNVFIAMFLCTIIELERYRWNYGRKWRPKRMPSSKIKLPVDKEGKPDWEFMEDYIKCIKYSKFITH